jgi:hypothetical protein
MYGRLQEASAAEELRRSLDHLDSALKCRNSYQDEPDLDAAIYRARAISAYYINDRDRLIETFSRWFREFPSDPHATSEWVWISGHLNLTKGDLDLPAAEVVGA